MPLLALLLASACGGGDSVKGPAPTAPDLMRLRSPAFADGDAIPLRYTCDGDETSPPLRWAGTPARAKELALLMEDPDAPGGTFVHWVVLRLRPALRAVPKGRVPSGAIEAAQSFGDKRYGGPCPPKGDKPHHYVFTLYALDVAQLGVSGMFRGLEVLNAMKGHVLEEAKLTGVYSLNPDVPA